MLISLCRVLSIEYKKVHRYLWILTLLYSLGILKLRRMNQLLNSYKNTRYVLVVVAQLAERSLPILEVRGLYPVIGKKLFTVNCVLNRRK